MASRTWAVVVGRTGPDAKSRLAGMLPPRARSALAVAMLRDVLAAAGAAGLDGAIAVLDPSLSAEGVRVLPDRGAGLNAAVATGVAAAVAAGAETVIVLPGDVPLIDKEDVATLIAALDGPRSVVVAPDRHGSGTNALALRPGDVIQPAFGADSADRHEAAATSAGASARRAVIERVALDVDTPDDLRELMRRGARGETAAAIRMLAVG